ncbi:MAG: GNAT family N-acetyltransferase [Chloroflexi bacterium]|nr:MAG: GNAT family N-acetyltransferase [Chloroflexota bacterium]
MNDTDRFQTWQRDTLAGHDDGVEMLSAGPFRALLSAGDGATTGWATLIDGAPTEAETTKSLTKLRTAFKKHKVALEIEYNETVFPKVGHWLEAAGLKLRERNPLMSCRPDSFKPFATPDEVHLTQLSAGATPAELEAFQAIRWTDGGELDRVPQPVERLRADMARPNSVFLLAWLEWEPAGTGVSHAVKGAAEIVGVVTRKDRRRRGVAAAITSELVRRHFANGGDFAFLDAANEEATRVYERLGFSRFGANLIYR